MQKQTAAEILDERLAKQGFTERCPGPGYEGFWTTGHNDTDEMGCPTGRICYRSGGGKEIGIRELRRVAVVLMRLGVAVEGQVNDYGYGYLVVTITPDLWKELPPPPAPNGEEAEQATA